MPSPVAKKPVESLPPFNRSTSEDSRGDHPNDMPLPSFHEPSTSETHPNSSNERQLVPDRTTTSDQKAPRMNSWCLDHDKGKDAYLTEEVVEWYMNWLCSQKRNKKFKAIETWCWHLYMRREYQLDEINDETGTTFFLPICQGSHWTLIVFNHEHHYFLDPLNPSADPQRRTNRFLSSLKGTLERFKPPIPQQKDGVNCGVHVCLIAKSLVNGTKWHTDRDVRNFRKDLKKLMLDHGVEFFQKNPEEEKEKKKSQEKMPAKSNTYIKRKSRKRVPAKRKLDSIETSTDQVDRQKEIGESDRGNSYIHGSPVDNPPVTSSPVAETPVETLPKSESSTSEDSRSDNAMDMSHSLFHAASFSGTPQPHSSHDLNWTHVPPTMPLNRIFQNESTIVQNTEALGGFKLPGYMEQHYIRCCVDPNAIELPFADVVKFFCPRHLENFLVGFYLPDRHQYLKYEWTVEGFVIHQCQCQTVMDMDLIRMANSGVEMLETPSIADRPRSSDKEGMDQEDESFLAYVATLPFFTAHFCVEHKIMGVGVKNASTGDYTYFHQQQRSLVECPKCRVAPVIQASLLPVYAEYSERLRHFVVHVFNILTLVNEQYIFDNECKEFKQVFDSNLVYDGTKGSPGTVLFYPVGPGPFPPIAVTKRGELGLGLVTWCKDTEEEIYGVFPVNTLIMQMKKKREQQILEIWEKNPAVLTENFKKFAGPKRVMDRFLKNAMELFSKSLPVSDSCLISQDAPEPAESTLPLSGESNLGLRSATQLKLNSHFSVSSEKNGIPQRPSAQAPLGYIEEEVIELSDDE